MKHWINYERKKIKDVKMLEVELVSISSRKYKPFCFELMLALTRTWWNCSRSLVPLEVHFCIEGEEKSLIYRLLTAKQLKRKHNKFKLQVRTENLCRGLESVKEQYSNWVIQFLFVIGIFINLNYSIEILRSEGMCELSSKRAYFLNWKYAEGSLFGVQNILNDAAWKL